MPSQRQYMFLPLKGSLSDHQCGQMMAVKDFVSWILTSSEAQSIAAALNFATMSIKISQSCIEILERMECDRLPLAHAEWRCT